jgi:urea carboxylase
MGMATRYSFGGDDHIFVEVDEEMSLDAFFKSLSMTNAVRESRIKGVTEICPANASYQIRFDPDLISPNDMLAELKRLQSAAGKSDRTLSTRILEVPVYYNDPWTHETLMRFREKQIEVPKYLRPRTDTPKLTVGHGGCFGCIYSVRGAGGYQLFGITPMPIYDPRQEVSYLSDFMIFFKPGDIVKFKPVDRAGYDAAIELVNAGRFEPTMRPVAFSLDEFHEKPAATNEKLLGALHGA